MLKITKQAVLKIFAKRNSPNLKFVYYEPDKSGYIEVLLKGEQIFCEESGTLYSQIKDLKKEIVQRKKELEKLQEAIEILKSYEEKLDENKT